MNFNPNAPRKKREIPKTIKGQEQEILLLSEVYKAKQDLLTGHALEQQELKKSLDKKINSLQTELDKLNAQLTSLKAESEGYKNKLNELTAQEEELNSLLKSYSLPLTFDAAIEDQYRLVKSKLKNARQYEVYVLGILKMVVESITTDFNNLIKFTKESPAIESLTSHSFFQWVRSLFQWIFEKVSLVYHSLITYLNPIIIPLKERTSSFYLEASQFFDTLVSNIIMGTIVFLNGTWYVVQENQFTRNHAEMWYFAIVVLWIVVILYVVSDIVRWIYSLLVSGFRWIFSK